MSTFKKKAKTPPTPPSTKRRFPVWVVIRHTRAGDIRRAVIDDKVSSVPGAMKPRDIAMGMAEEIADEAARIYGHGSASVFKGTLILNDEAEQP